MNNFGYFRTAACAPIVHVANPMANAITIIKAVKENAGCDLYLFPELSITGYTCADLFNQSRLLDSADEAMAYVASQTENINAVIIVGAPVRVKNSLYNCAVAMLRGNVIAIVPKTYIPNYNEFYEKRWFDTPYKNSGHETPLNDTIIEFKGVKIGIEICEDLWVPEPPSGHLVKHGADIIANLSASNEVLGKHRYLIDLIRHQSARCRCGYVYASAGTGESSTDLVFAGNTVIAEDGVILASSPRFKHGQLFTAADIDIEKLRNDRRKFNSFANNIIPDTNFTDYRNNLSDKIRNIVPDTETLIQNPDRKLMRPVEKYPFVPSDKRHKDENCSEIIEIQCWGLQQRLEAIHCHKIVVGISGGLDSTLALLVAVRTFDNMNIDRKGIYAITMPGMATTNRTHNNAWQLMRLLGVTSLEIPIGDAVSLHFRDIDHNPDNHDATYENSQARERTQILMDYANKVGGIVLGTGDLSELALGWATYNGDHMSMYGINSSIPKTLVRHLVEWFAERAENKQLTETLQDIINTPISPELVPSDDGDDIAQKTEELVGPYELHDFFLFHTLRNGFSPQKIYMLALNAFSDEYPEITIRHWLQNFYHRFFSQQFKRSCMPDGPKVGSVCLSPRGDWRMPSDADATIWSHP